MKLLMLGFQKPPIGGVTVWCDQFRKLIEKEVDFFRFINIGFKKRSIYIKITQMFLPLKLIYILHKFKPDVIHLVTNLSKFGSIRDVILVYLLNIFKKKVILHYHCNIEDQIDFHKNLKCLRFLVNNVSINVFINQSSQNFVKKFSDNKSIIIPNFTEKTYSKAINEKISNITYIGHLNRQKGIDILIELAKLKKGIEFHLVGKNQDYINYDFPENIFIHGEVGSNEINKFYLAADLFIFPSFSEGFSLSLLDAMAYGCPIIASNVGSNREMLENNGGIIIDTGLVNDYYIAIERLDSLDLREKISFWNIQKVKEEYLSEIVIHKWVDTYFSLTL
jgi:L-malate glycosyltransferase